MVINGAVEQYRHITMLRVVDNLIIYKMIEEYTKTPIEATLNYYEEFNDYSGIFYESLWEGLIVFLDMTGIGEAELVQDTLRINLYSYEGIYDEDYEELDFCLNEVFKELKLLKCSVWNEDGFIFLYLEDFDFENHLIAEQLLKLDKYCLELGEKYDNKN